MIIKFFSSPSLSNIVFNVIAYNWKFTSGTILPHQKYSSIDIPFLRIALRSSTATMMVSHDGLNSNITEEKKSSSAPVANFPFSHFVALNLHAGRTSIPFKHVFKKLAELICLHLLKRLTRVMGITLLRMNPLTNSRWYMLFLL